MDKQALRVRMFAGSNGSGKSTLIKNLKEKIIFEVYLNADEIEEEIKRNTYLDLDRYSLALTNDQWLEYLKSQPSILSKISEDIDIKIDHNFLVVTNQVEFSYLAAVITDFLREMLFQAKKSLSLLYQAIKVTDRAYIFDNSGTEPKYIAEITSGKQIEMKINNSPNWSNKYVLSKSF